MNFVKFNSILFIICGILFNEWIIASLFSYDSTISRLDLRLCIWFIQLVFIGVGIALLLLEKKHSILFKRILKNTYVCLFSIVLSLLFSEWLVRIIRPTPNGFPTGTILFEPDTKLGWTFINSVQTQVTWPMEAQVEVQINSNGFRDIKELDDGGIWVFGDSFVSALEVEDKQRFTSILETRLNQHIYNFGVNGYGPVQYYLLMDSLLASHQPELIIVMIYIRNDLYDASGAVDWMHGFKRPIIKQDSILYTQNRLNESIKEDQKRYLKSNPIRLEDSHLFNLIQLAFLPKDDKRLQAPELGLLKIESDSLHIAAYEASFSALELIEKRLQTGKIPHVFVLAPSVVQVQTELWENLVESYQLNPSLYDLTLPQKRLIKWFNEHHSTFLDLQPYLKEIYQKEHSPLYFERNEHWNALGHQHVAQFLMNHFSHD